MKHPSGRRADLAFPFPDPPLHVVLVEPEIPPNTGNVARMCAATGTRLHLVGNLGFSLDHAKLRRAGLDYWDSIRPERHADFESFLAAARPSRLHLFSAGGARTHFAARFSPGDALVFGPETRGLPASLLGAHPDAVVAIPILTDHVRSLNLSTAAGVAVYEALRQIAAQRGAPGERPG